MSNSELGIKRFNCHNFIWSIDTRYKITFFSVLIFGVLAHGMVMFNHFYYHDDMNLFGEHDNLVASGRWLLSAMSAGLQDLTGTPNFILPLPYCILSLLLIAVIGCILVWFLDLKSKKSAILTGAVLSVYPSVTCSFGYLCTTPYYMISLLMAVGGAVLCSKRYSLWQLMAGILMMTFSMSIYQAYIPFMLTLLLMSLIKDTVDTTESVQIKQFLWNVAGKFGSVACAGFIYLLTLKLSLLITNTALTTYNGANEWNTNILDYLSRITLTYRKFVIVDWTLFLDRRFHFIFISFFILLSAKIVVQKYKVNKRNGILLGILLVLFPMVVTSIYIMCPLNTIHALMLYGNTLVFVLFLWFLEKAVWRHISLKRTFKGASFIVYCLLLYSFVKLDNACYMKAMFCQHQAISYFTTLITRIKSLPEYTDGKKVVFINECRIEDKSIAEIAAQTPFHEIKMLPYWDVNGYLNNYNWLNYMKYWCGYSPQLANPSEYEDLPLVKEMPAYPDAGSIAIVNGTIVVKMSE